MRQGLDDFEILIFDNASEDNTENLIRSLHNGHIRYVRNRTNLGATENGNLCLANSRGRYVKFLCADDVLLDGVLRKQISILENHPEVVLVSCGYLATDPNLNFRGLWSAFPGMHPGHRVINVYLSMPLLLATASLPEIPATLRHRWRYAKSCRRLRLPSQPKPNRRRLRWMLHPHCPRRHARS